MKFIAQKKFRIISIGILLVFLTSTLFSEVMSGKIIKIVDGDTVHFLPTDSNKKLKIRLASLDAPERKQPYGKKAKRYLSSLIGNKVVTIEYKKKDRYGRIIGLIRHQQIDINLEMIKAGYAWHYKKYQKEQTINERKNYARSEIIARDNQIGLWKNKNALAPWEWRKQKKARHKNK